MATLTVPESTKVTFKKGDRHTGVWAIQRCLNSFVDIGFKLLEDGDFGPSTESNIKAYQASVDLTADGIVGPATQSRICQSCIVRADPDKKVPAGLLRALTTGESGNLIAAVNLMVAGGVDCGFTQRRIYGPDYSQDEIKRAFDSLLQVTRLRDDILARFVKFAKYPYVDGRSDTIEYAWRLAMLEHNWPYGASVLADGRQLSTRTATWVPKGTRFKDGTAVITYRDWAKFYAMGSKSHQHVGLVVQGVYGVPIDG